ncbi:MULTISPECIES: hypothetical protein [Thermus]|uniref:hypothetical protein n=1 Tax=Thermus TaxID=270 RepID=UPI001F3BCB9B|nr:MULTISPECIES: hypothetical protein [Thermus]
MPFPAKKVNDLGRAASALRRALKTAVGLLDDPDPQTRLRAVHAVAQAATALARVHEARELEQRVAELEAAVEGLAKPQRRTA